MSASQSFDLDLSSKYKQKEIIDLGNPFDTETLDSISSVLDDAIRNDDERLEKVTYNGKVYTERLTVDAPAFNFAERMPELEKLVSNQVVKENLYNYYQSYFRPYRIQVWRNYHVPQEIFEESELYSSYWHFDGNPQDTIKLFVNLNEVTENHGPFHVLSRKDSKKASRHDYSLRKKSGIPDSTIQNKYDVQTHRGPAGSAMLANTNLCLHRAGYPSEGNHRDIIQIMFCPAHEPLDPDWLTESTHSLDSRWNYKMRADC